MPQVKEVPKFEADHSVERVVIMSKVAANVNSVLDVGCGYGYALQQMNTVFPSARLAGVDVDATKLGLAESFTDKAEFYTSTVYKMPFRNKEFDWVFCHHTIEHLDEMEIALDELRRVARVGLFLTVPLENDEHFYKLQAKGLRKKHNPIDMHKFHTTDPLVWLSKFAHDDWKPVYYQFTNFSDIITAFVRDELLHYGGSACTECD
jgi:ubiquinone/menaquinone biosynthesis C-methylase UbiE